MVCAHLAMTSWTCWLTDKRFVTVTPSILTDVTRWMSGIVGGWQIWSLRLPSVFMFTFHVFTFCPDIQQSPRKMEWMCFVIPPFISPWLHLQFWGKRWRFALYLTVVWTASSRSWRYVVWESLLVADGEVVKAGSRGMHILCAQTGHCLSCEEMHHASDDMAVTQWAVCLNCPFACSISRRLIVLL